MDVAVETNSDPWGPYVNYDDVARLQYGRLLWKNAAFRERLLNHWLDVRHPYRERFIERRHLIEGLLTSNESFVEADSRLRLEGTSLRCVAREIPPVFGSFF
jgi:hypothetical protein